MGIINDYLKSLSIIKKECIPPILKISADYLLMFGEINYSFAIASNSVPGTFIASIAIASATKIIIGGCKSKKIG